MGPYPQIIAKTYDFLMYLIPVVSGFSRPNRYLLGERLERTGLEVLELLLEAVFTSDKSLILKKANLKIEQARFYVRLCKDLRLMGLKQYEVVSGKLNEMGIQLGGWIKQQKKRT